MSKIFAVACALLVVPVASAAPQAQDSSKATIHWQPWGAPAFAAARAEHKLLVLDLEAIWCHWCHVMDEVTYRDAKVIRLMNEHVIALKVDQDARPDLANRYEDYGWPATIVFASDGTELAKRSGYLDPTEMAAMLAAFIADPTPGPSAAPPAAAPPPQAAAGSGEFTPQLLQTLGKNQQELYDTEQAGWGEGHKYIEWNSAEYALEMARGGDAQAAAAARASLSAGLALIDPVWGGVYQYSVGGDWHHPHFEKIMQFQAEILRIYALASLQPELPAADRAAYLQAAQSIRGFLDRFMRSAAGAYYTSMDADIVQGKGAEDYFRLRDTERRQRGVPRVDTNVYARENGWAIRGLAVLYAATGDQAVLADATTAMAWLTAHRALAGGGYSHKDASADQANGGPYLGDTLAVGMAALALYEVTADPAYLRQSQAAAAYLVATFREPHALGWLTAAAVTGDRRSLEPNRDEMIQAARYGNLLYQYSGDAAAQQLATGALRYLAQPAVAQRQPAAGVLLAAAERVREPVHITIVAAKTDHDAAALYQAALRFPSAYKRVEWWDRRAGPLPRQDVSYPELPKAAAFACSGTRCSLPLFAPATLVAKVSALTQPAGRDAGK